MPISRPVPQLGKQETDYVGHFILCTGTGLCLLWSFLDQFHCVGLFWFSFSYVVVSVCATITIGRISRIGVSESAILFACPIFSSDKASLVAFDARAYLFVVCGTFFSHVRYPSCILRLIAVIWKDSEISPFFHLYSSICRFMWYHLGSNLLALKVFELDWLNVVEGLHLIEFFPISLSWYCEELLPTNRNWFVVWSSLIKLAVIQFELPAVLFWLGFGFGPFQVSYRFRFSRPLQSKLSSIKSLRTNYLIH